MLSITCRISEFIRQQIYNESASFFFASICIFLIPFYTYYLPPFLILWLIFRVVEIISLKKRGEEFYFSSSHTRKVASLFILYFLLQVAGLIYTKNISNGLNIIFSRLSLLVFPLLFISPGKKILEKSNYLLRVFAAGTILFIIYNLIYAAFRSISIVGGELVIDTHPGESWWLSYFRGSDFSVTQHPSYSAIFVVFSSLICIHAALERGYNRTIRVMWSVSAVLLLVAVYLLSSRSGFLIFLVSMPIYFFIRLRRRLIIAALFVVMILAVALSIIKTNDRIRYYMDEITNGNILEENTDSRILIWKSGLNVINKNPFFGVGIGDVRDELMKEYLALGNEDIITSRYNAHNQYIEVAIEGGIVSLGVFLSILIYLGYIAVKYRSIFTTLFVLIMSISFMFESVLYRFAGVVFFAALAFVVIQNDFRSRKSDIL